MYHVDRDLHFDRLMMAKIVAFDKCLHDPQAASTTLFNSSITQAMHAVYGGGGGGARERWGWIRTRHSYYNGDSTESLAQILYELSSLAMHQQIFVYYGWEVAPGTCDDPTQLATFISYEARWICREVVLLFDESSEPASVLSQVVKTLTEEGSHQLQGMVPVTIDCEGLTMEKIPWIFIGKTPEPLLSSVNSTRAEVQVFHYPTKHHPQTRLQIEVYWEETRAGTKRIKKLMLKPIFG